MLNTKGVEELLRRVGLGRGNARWAGKIAQALFRGENGGNMWKLCEIGNAFFWADVEAKNENLRHPRVGHDMGRWDPNFALILSNLAII